MGSEDGEVAPRRNFVLVAKALTKSDTAGRVILPRVSVESNLSFLMGYRCVPSPICLHLMLFISQNVVQCVFHFNEY